MWTPDVKSSTLLSLDLWLLSDRSASREKAVLETCQESFLLLEEADRRSLLHLVVLLLSFLWQAGLPDQLQLWRGVAHVSDFFEHLQQRTRDCFFFYKLFEFFKLNRTEKLITGQSECIDIRLFHQVFSIHWWLTKKPTRHHFSNLLDFISHIHLIKSQ